MIPDEAVEAAAKAVFYDDRTRTREEMFRLALEAAAPFVAAQAMRETYDAMLIEQPALVATWLRERLEKVTR